MKKYLFACFIMFADMSLGVAVAATPPPATPAEKLIIKRYNMGKCVITKTRHWDEQRRHWDVNSRRDCR